jgi:hypothetical protein
MLQDVLKDDDFLQVLHVWRLVNISGMVRDGEEVKVYKKIVLTN